MTKLGAADAVAAADWRAAVRRSAETLVGLGVADAAYPGACLAVVEANGPYIVLTQGLALVHARPEDGGLGVGVSVTRLAAPVAFGHPQNDPVDLLIAFCTPDAQAHVASLSALARALSAGLPDKLRAAASGPDALIHELKEALPDDLS